MQYTTLSSVGTSSGIILNPVAKKTTVQLSASANSSFDVTIQVTLDDPTSLSTTAVTWTGLSTTHYSSLALTAADGILLFIDSPIGGLRISSSTLTATTLTLKALQSVTA